jgi:hypothetical protein
MYMNNNNNGFHPQGAQGWNQSRSYYQGGNANSNSFTPRLDVGIGAWNQELEFTGTNTIIWMSLELEIGNMSEYRAAFTSLARTLEQI